MRLLPVSARRAQVCSEGCRGAVVSTDASEKAAMDVAQQLEHERMEADLRADYHEAIENVEKLHKKTSADILHGVRTRLKTAKWMAHLGDHSESVLEEIHMHIVEEQEEVRALHERSVVKLRAAIDAFHEGMAQKHVEVQKQAKEAEKDKLLDSRAAASEEVEIAKRKQGDELNEKMRSRRRGIAGATGAR